MLLSEFLDQSNFGGIPVRIYNQSVGSAVGSIGPEGDKRLITYETLNNSHVVSIKLEKNQRYGYGNVFCIEVSYEQTNPEIKVEIDKRIFGKEISLNLKPDKFV